MNQSQMLQRMCHAVLAKVDLKAIVKSRGFPPAATNPAILAGLFLTEQGVAEAFRSLDREEISALHLLKAVGTPVDISFFDRIYKAGTRYGTFTQKHQNVLTKVRDRLVRSGVLLMSDVSGSGREAKMELWRFALPASFYPHLPPLLESPRMFPGPGDCQPSAVRQKLLADLACSAPVKEARVPAFQVAGNELRMGNAPFRETQVRSLHFALWKQQLDTKPKNNDAQVPHSLEPHQAVYQLLAGLEKDLWAVPGQIAGVVQVFSGRKIDCRAACDAGWQVGLLARDEFEGRYWYRSAPLDEGVVPDQYLEARDKEQCVAIDLHRIPWTALETVTQLGDVKQNPTSASTLLLTPSVLRLGRASDQLLGSDVAEWLFHRSSVFSQAREKLHSRRGKTVLHRELLIARVTDLSLKVSLEKALGDKWVALKNDYVAFPCGALNEVQRIMKKSGHVIKEICAP